MTGAKLPPIEMLSQVPHKTQMMASVAPSAVVLELTLVLTAVATIVPFLRRAPGMLIRPKGMDLPHCDIRSPMFQKVAGFL